MQVPYILDYDMQSNSVSKFSQKAKVIFKFELGHFKLIFVRSMYLRKF